MPRSHESPNQLPDVNQTPEAEVLEHARRYALAHQGSGRLQRERVLAIEDERLAECDLHAASNDRLAVNLASNNRTMGFTGTTVAPSGDGPLDRETGAASHRFQVLLEARERLDVLCDRAKRQVNEAHEALVSATAALAVDPEKSQNTGGHDEGFGILVGGGTRAKDASDDEEITEAVTSAA